MGNPDSSFAPLDEEVVAQWLDSLDLSSSTKNTYKRAFKSFCAFVKDTSLDFDTLTKRDIISFREYLSVDKRLKPTTVSNYLGAVRSFFSYAEENGIPNIARGVRGERASRDFKKASLSVDQARRLLSAVDLETEAGMRDFALLNLMLRTGLRDIEVVRADCGDIQTVSGVDVLYIQGKGRPGKDNYVVLTESALAPIRDYLGMRDDPRGSSPLFTSVARRNSGERLTTRSVSRIVKEAMRKIGIDDPRYTAHSLRHTAITFSLLGGASEREAQQMARHADISTTMIYAHNIDRIKNAAENNISRLLD